jgi:hypothetical protein
VISRLGPLQCLCGRDFRVEYRKSLFNLGGAFCRGFQTIIDDVGNLGVDGFPQAHLVVSKVVPQPVRYWPLTKRFPPVGTVAFSEDFIKLADAFLDELRVSRDRGLLFW